jgi:hypothetical protein
MQDFARMVFHKLIEKEVEFVVVGGVSAVLQGVPIVTQDLDLCYRRTPENMRKLVEVLVPLNARPRGLPADVPVRFDERSLQMGCNFTLEIEDEHLDLLGEMSGIGNYEQVLPDTILLTFETFTLRTLSIQQLIATKEAANRPKDHAALPTLRAFRDLQSNSLGGSTDGP